MQSIKVSLNQGRDLKQNIFEFILFTFDLNKKPPVRMAFRLCSLLNCLSSCRLLFYFYFLQSNIYSFAKYLVGDLSYNLFAIYEKCWNIFNTTVKPFSKITLYLPAIGSIYQVIQEFFVHYTRFF